MWYVYTSVIIFVVFLICYCAMIKLRIQFIFKPYDFYDFLERIGGMIVISASWIVVFPIAILLGIFYLVYLFLTN